MGTDSFNPDTQYTENERELEMKVMERFGINPFAVKLLVDAYFKFVAPVPFSTTFTLPKKDFKMDFAGGKQSQVEVYIYKPGYVGRKFPSKKPIDQGALKLLAHSYYSHVRPYPISFLYNGAEIHLRTPGFEEFRKKNIAREIYNPTK